jgi:LPS O-antigen subunit length determinant protein (WzzB/FepE family)
VKETKYRIKMDEERVSEQKRLRQQELKQANKMNTQLKIEEEKNKISG